MHEALGALHERCVPKIPTHVAAPARDAAPEVGTGPSRHDCTRAMATVRTLPCDAEHRACVADVPFRIAEQGTSCELLRCAPTWIVVAHVPHVQSMPATAPPGDPFGPPAPERRLGNLHDAPHPAASIPFASGGVEARLDVRDRHQRFERHMRSLGGDERLCLDARDLGAVRYWDVHVSAHDRARDDSRVDPALHRVTVPASVLEFQHRCGAIRDRFSFHSRRREAGRSNSSPSS